MTESHGEGARVSVYKTRGFVKAITGFIPLLSMWAASDFTPISEPVKHGNWLAIGLLLTVGTFGAYVDARTSTHENERGLDFIEIRSQMLWDIGMSLAVYALFKHAEVAYFLQQLNTRH